MRNKPEKEHLIIKILIKRAYFMDIYEFLVYTFYFILTRFIR